MARSRRRRPLRASRVPLAIGPDYPLPRGRWELCLFLSPFGRDGGEQDRRAGRRPCAIIASAGTTNTGAVDPIAELAGDRRRRAESFDVFGRFQLTDRGRKSLAGIERADSNTPEPHKGTFLPYGTGALLVGEGGGLGAGEGGGRKLLEGGGGAEAENPNLLPPAPPRLGRGGLGGGGVMVQRAWGGRGCSQGENKKRERRGGGPPEAAGAGASRGDGAIVPFRCGGGGGEGGGRGATGNGGGGKRANTALCFGGWGRGGGGRFGKRIGNSATATTG